MEFIRTMSHNFLLTRIVQCYKGINGAMFAELISVLGVDRRLPSGSSSCSFTLINMQIAVITSPAKLFFARIASSHAIAAEKVIIPCTPLPVSTIFAEEAFAKGTFVFGIRPVVREAISDRATFTAQKRITVIAFHHALVAVATR